MQSVLANDEVVLKVGEWGVLKGQEEGMQYCYAISVPTETRAFYSDYPRAPYLLVVYVSPDRFTIGVDSGYVLDKQKGVMVTLSDRTRLFNIVNVYHSARTYSSLQDSAIIDDMIESEGEMIVESFGTENRKAIDYYSLKPVKQVLSYMINNCN